MRLLFDTNVVLWWLNDRTERLERRVRALIEDESTEVFVSTATVWEASIKRAQGKLPEAEGMLDALERSQAELLPILPRHADRAGALPPHHHDPFDRLIVAHAQVEGLPLVSGDARLGAYGIEILW